MITFVQISYLIVDEMHEEHHELMQDAYWDEVYPDQLPYTPGSESTKTKGFMGSTHKMKLEKTEVETLTPLVELQEVKSTPSAPPKTNSVKLKGLSQLQHI